MTKPLAPPTLENTLDPNISKINRMLKGKTPPCMITLPVKEVGDLHELVKIYRSVGWVIDHCSDAANHYVTFRSGYKWMAGKQKPVSFMVRIKEFFGIL